MIHIKLNGNVVSLHYPNSLAMTLNRPGDVEEYIFDIDDTYAKIKIKKKNDKDFQTRETIINKDNMCSATFKFEGTTPPTLLIIEGESSKVIEIPLTEAVYINGYAALEKLAKGNKSSSDINKLDPINTGCSENENTRESLGVAKTDTDSELA